MYLSLKYTFAKLRERDGNPTRLQISYASFSLRKEGSTASERKRSCFLSNN